MAANKLSPKQLSRRCDPHQFGFKTTAEVEAFDGLIGQDRALKALQFGLDVRAPGYNVYVAGPVGTGRTSHSRILVERRAKDAKPAADWCYVYNFDSPDQPLALELPPGEGPAFAASVAELVNDLSRGVTQVFSSQDYEDQRRKLVERGRSLIQTMVAGLEQAAAAEGFVLRQTEQGVSLALRDEALMEKVTSGTADPRVKKAVEEKAAQLHDRIGEAMRQVFALEKEVADRLRALDQRTGGIAVHVILQGVKDRHAGHPAVVAWLERLGEDVIQNLQAFRAPEPLPPPLAVRYRAKVLVSGEPEGGAPVVFEPNPTYPNLFGKIEVPFAPPGSPPFLMDVTLIQPGALHKANGGYLILQAEDLLRSPGAWEGLKRTLLTRELRIEPMPDGMRLVMPPPMKPQPIPVNVKIILIGSPQVYQLLWSLDEGFRKLFKVKAEFDNRMEWTDENLKQYVAFIANLVQREGMCHLDCEAVARVAEYSCRLAGDRKYLSTEFNEVIEVLYESHAWAQRDGSDIVRAEHVSTAIREKVARAALIEERIQEMIRRGHLLVDVDGEAVGQVNGLTVLSTGQHTFGLPSRITAKVFMGRKGIVHIERETGVSGTVHSKGVLTLAGYLGGKYARNRPLSLSASLAFEQMYNMVDGDSASSTELYALLSALSGVPIRQGLAVTGSVDQHGAVQPVGGVTHKVEGFFYTCRTKGLTGRQGVLVPHQNVENLMLDEAVVAAVEQGEFHIWAVHSIDEGLEILTGVPAAEIHAKVDRRLDELARELLKFERPGEA